MKISAGNTNLYKIITSLVNLIDNSKEYENINPSIASIKIVDEFYENLFLSPLVFYVSNGSIVESNSDDDFEKYADDIFYIESLYVLFLCMNLSQLEQKKIEVSWIVCEMNKAVQKTRAFHDVAFLDYHMERNNTVGRLDYARMDNLFFQKYKKENLGKFLKKKGEYFFPAIFGVVSAERKGNYAKQTLLYIDNPKSIEITDKEKKKKHNYHCPICNAEHLVYLNGNEKSKANIQDYIKLNRKYIEFLCNHDATEYSGIVRFGFDAEKFNFILQTDEQYNQAFLYLFHRGSFNDGKIMYYKNENELADISVDKFHENRLKNA